MSKFEFNMMRLYIQVTNAPALWLDALRRSAERGDADSSGSTLRVMGVVALVLAVVAVLGAAAFNVANTAVVQLGQR
ncbi:MAG TPA: hypothetical protein VGK87_04315 [Anaerolineae bacterium]|jgi:hypothetical protein